jgi:putative ABC transport system permease protein
VRAEQTKSVKTSLVLLQGGALFVLLLGCVNVAGLLLARANSRQIEWAVRRALGASRGAIARQVLTESLLFVVVGSLAGLALAWASLHVINQYTAPVIRQAPPVSLDGTVLAVTLLGTVGVALLTGLFPLARLWSDDSSGSIHAGGRGASTDRRLRAMSGLLVTAQVSLAVVLLVGAGLLIRSFAQLVAIDPGFASRKVVHARVALNISYQNVAKAHGVADQIIAKMREIPGVEAVSISSHMLINGQFPVVSLPIRGSVLGQPATYPSAAILGVSPEFFATMGIRILEGRGLTEADDLPHARGAYVVDRNFAEKYFPGRSAVGETLGFGGPNQPAESWPVIVGVAEVARFNGPEDRSGVPFIYASVKTFQFGGFSLEIRTARGLTDLLPIMRTKLRSIDSTLPLYQVDTLQMLLDRVLAKRRGMMLLLGTFAMIALIVSAVGLYGMLAYDVSQRTREIGIRGAIGASRVQIVGLILRQGMWNTGIGVLIGLAAAFYLTRFMASLLYGIHAADPAVYIAVSLLLLGVALAASFVPALRAARVDPIVALRCE